MDQRKSITLPHSCRIVQLKESAGEWVRRKQALFVFETVSSGDSKPTTSKAASNSDAEASNRRQEYASALEGQLEKWLVRPGDIVPSGSEGGDTREDARVSILMTHEHRGLFVSPEEASRLEMETARRLKKEKKLSLILDLDQTVIHATVDPSVGAFMNHEQYKDLEVMKELFAFKLPDNPKDFYYVKLRPGLSHFLKEVLKLYELHIYTMGTRNYANEISKIIDPEGDIFKERILSRDESGSFTEKNIQRLFPCDDSMVVIMDDRADVWKWSQNLIKVRPYLFFTNTGDINAPPGAQTRPEDARKRKRMEENLPPPTADETITTPTEIVSSEEVMLPFPTTEDDHELAGCLKALRQLHQKYYQSLIKAEEPAVKELLPKIKSKVLEGTHLVFSGIIPLGHPAEHSEIWTLATSFGATCHKNVDEQVTHVIASKWGTNKVKQALSMKTKIQIVRPEWLYQSISRWQKLSVDQYRLPPASPITTVDDPDTPSEKRLRSEPDRLEVEQLFGSRTATPNLDSDILLLDQSEMDDLNREILNELEDLSQDEDTEEIFEDTSPDTERTKLDQRFIRSRSRSPLSNAVWADEDQQSILDSSSGEEEQSLRPKRKQRTSNRTRSVASSESGFSDLERQLEMFSGEEAAEDE